MLGVGAAAAAGAGADAVVAAAGAALQISVAKMQPKPCIRDNALACKTGSPLWSCDRDEAYAYERDLLAEACIWQQLYDKAMGSCLR